jgi:hypothetical protein
MPTLPPDYAHVCTYYHHCARTHAHVHNSIYLGHGYFALAGNTNLSAPRLKKGQTASLLCQGSMFGNTLELTTVADSSSRFTCSWHLFCECRVREPRVLLGSLSLTLYHYVCMHAGCLCIVCIVWVYVCIYVHIKACNAFC